MKIIVDADACPVKQIIENLCMRNQLKLIFVSNHHHMISSDWGDIIIVDADSQSADIAIANLATVNDIVVTQDYGLASMVLGKKAKAISPGGRVYTMDNIDGLLMQRFLNARARQAREKIKGPKKRNNEDDMRFEKNFSKLISSTVNEID